MKSKSNVVVEISTPTTVKDKQDNIYMPGTQEYFDYMNSVNDLQITITITLIEGKKLFK